MATTIKKEKEPFYVTIANRLIEQLEQGTAPWQRPWNAGVTGERQIPFNPVTNKRYRGINAISLMMAGGDDNRWMTYKQAASIGAQVRKGEKGMPVQYWQFHEQQTLVDEKGRPVLDEQGKPKKIQVELERPRVFFATVFNGSQIDGLPPLPPLVEQPLTWNPAERVEKLLASSGARIKHVPGDRAYYRPSTDDITLPEKAQFPTAESYYATALHELGHWTGHESRLARDLGHPFGSEGYAKEELRAEIASMMLGMELGIGHDPGQHAAYVKSWIKVLTDDPKEILRAASDAEKIQGYVMAFEQKQELEQAQEQTQELGENGLTAAQAQRLPEEVSSDQVSQERIYIAATYEERKEVKEAGAKWDRNAKSWYITADQDQDRFSKWLTTEAATPAPQGQSDDQPEPRVYLAVPYADRAKAKEAGARWDANAKSWYVGPNADKDKLQRWSLDAQKPEQGPALSPSEEFKAVMRENGLEPPEQLVVGKWARARAEGDSSKQTSGTYRYFEDGTPNGQIVNHRAGIDMKWVSKGYHLSDAERAVLRAVAAEKQAQQQQAIEAEYDRNAQALTQSLPAMKDATDDAVYLQKKGISARPGLKQNKYGNVIIPAQDTNDKVWTAQTVYDDGNKRYQSNSRKSGCFHVLGAEPGKGMALLAKQPVLIIGEGYATMATIADAAGHATVAAFDSGNLLPVAAALRENFPDKPIVIAGDDDTSQPMTLGRNSGREKATEAAQAVGAAVMFPVFAPGEGTYPESLPPVTPEAYRRKAVTPEQLAAIDNMKKYTDFNDVEQRSKLGLASVQMSLRSAIAEAHKIQNDQRQSRRQEQSLTAAARQRRTAGASA